MGRISVNRIPCTARVERRYNYSFARLARYSPPFVANAEKEISKMLGVENLGKLQNNALLLQEEFVRASRQKDASQARAYNLLPYFKASDYYIPPAVFAGIHSAISMNYGFKELEGKNVLEIGANWGPYMHYLRHQYGANTYGVDRNEIAVEYARQGGLNFIPGNASKMDFFQSNAFDMVISRHFLDYAYISQFFFKKTTPLMENILTEVHRVLKPEGFFFSHEEDIENLSPAYNLFSKFNSLGMTHSNPVVILQK
jgi:SAM-dependent methyltransferase